MSPLVDARTGVFTCDECGGVAEYIRCKANPRAEEWYCSKCHKSYLCDEYAPKAKETVTLEP